jgi:hypothetical protein
MLSITVSDILPVALQVPVSGLPGAIGCVLLFGVSCVARAQTERLNRRSRRLRPGSRDERLADGHGRDGESL